MAYTDKFRKRGLGAITGYAGGSLQDEIDRMNQFDPTITGDVNATRGGQALNMPSGRATMESRPEDEIRAQQIAGRPYPNVFRSGTLPWVEPGEFIDETRRNKPSDYPDTERPRMVNPLRIPPPQPTVNQPQPNVFAAEGIREPRNQVVPPQTQADQYMATAQPVDEQPTPMRNLMTRPRVATNPFYDRMMNDPTRQERPREVTPVDEVTKSGDYLRSIQDKPLSWRDKFGLISQNISQNLGGTPLATRRQRDIARATGGLQQDLAVQGQGLKQQALENRLYKQEADIRRDEERVRQGDESLEIRRRGLMKPTWKSDAQGRLIRYTPQPDGSTRREVVENVTKTKLPKTVWADGVLKQFNDDTREWDDAVDKKGNRVTDQLRTPTQVEINGKTFTVSPNTAAMATATGERFNITEDRAERGEARADERDYRSRLAKAGDLVGKIDGAKAAMESANAKLIKNPRDADAREEYDGAKAYLAQAAKELGEGYGDLYEVGTGTEGTPYYKKREGVAPVAPTAPRRTTSKTGGGKGQRVSSENLNKVLGLP